MAVSLGYVTSHIPSKVCMNRITNCLLYILTFISFCIYFSVEIDTYKKKKKYSLQHHWENWLHIQKGDLHSFSLKITF